MTIQLHQQQPAGQIFKSFTFFSVFRPEDNCEAAGGLSDCGSPWVEGRDGVVKYFPSSNIEIWSGQTVDWRLPKLTVISRCNSVIVRVLLSGVFNDKILSIEKHFDSNIFPLHLTLTRNGRSDVPTREGNIIYGI